MPVRMMIVLLVLFLFTPAAAPSQDFCPPTLSDMEGPFYVPGAPVREDTGSGFVIEGTVRSAASCGRIPGARVEWWQANRSGRYDDAHRGARITDGEGRYRLETDPPPPYAGRPPHVHFKVFAAGYRTLTTQLYPREGESAVEMDFVLVPEPE